MMWNSFLERGKELAEKAKAAAENLDKQLNVTVGIGDDGTVMPPGSSSNIQALEADGTSTSAEGGAIGGDKGTSNDDYDDALNDNWDDDDAFASMDSGSAAAAASAPLAGLKTDKNESSSPAAADGPIATMVELPPPAQKNDDVSEGWDDSKVVFEEVNLETEHAANDDDLVKPVPDSSPSSVKKEEKKPEQQQQQHLQEQLQQQHTASPEIPNESVDAENKQRIIDADDDEQQNGSGVEQQNEQVREPEISKTIVDESKMKDLLPQPTEAYSTSLLSSSQDAEAFDALKKQVAFLQEQLGQREYQLVNKTEQLTQIQSMHEAEKEELRGIVNNTKEEARKRIQKAKEKVEQLETKLKAVAAAQNSTVGEASNKQEIIEALRAEGEKLARKQAEMEKSVRAAKGETRQLRDALEQEMVAKEEALEKIQKLEAELKMTQENLTAARKGESQAGKLEKDLLQTKEELERKSSTILSLEQQIKEFKATLKDLTVELEASRKGAAIETQREQQKLRKEHNDTISDLENKLRTTEKDAALREDTLRNEVNELRKRWQDAVRRADSLSMDIQSSTAPLLRQLEMAERQSRARAAAAAEVETKLRAELEEYVVTNEKLTKERIELKTKFSRLERAAKENEDQFKVAKSSLEEKTAKVKMLEDKLRDMECERSKKKQEYAEVERLANEGVARVRSEMTQTVVESEERYCSQIETLQSELRKEEDKRRQLERQVKEMTENVGSIMPPSAYPGSPVMVQVKQKKLRKSQGQEEILSGALSGLGTHYGDDDEEDDDDDDLEWPTAEENQQNKGSYAALEEINSRLKSAKVELAALRKSLAASEKAREQLAEELGVSRDAKERLPQLEMDVQELTEENNRLTLEIQAMQDEFEELKEFYKTQVSMLIDAKSASSSASTNGESNAHVVDDTLEDQEIQQPVAEEQAAASNENEDT